MVSNVEIMVVEDVKEDMKLIKYHLKRMGFPNVIEANDGDTALQLLNHSKVDLIIADRYMPNMDGLVLFQKLQENEKLKDIPFLMTTAEHEKEKIIDAMKLGISNYIIKPIDPENLESKVKRLLNVE